MYRLLSLLPALAILMTGSSYAMTLSDAFQRAIQHDPAVPQSVAIYNAQRYDSGQVAGQRLLQLNAYAQAYHGTSEYVSNFPGLGSGESTGNQYAYGLEARQPLFRRDWLALGRQGKALDELAEVGQQDRIQRMILRLADRYFGVLREIENLELALSERESMAKALEDTRNRHQAGVVAETDLREAQARFDLARAQAMRVEVALTSARAALHEVTNNGHAPLPRLHSDVVLPQLNPASEDEWVALAREKSLVLLQARENVRVSKAVLSSSRSAYTPTQDAVGR
jgi:outer membrane protein